MRYRIGHVTTYRYSEPVSLSHNLVHLAPRGTPGQRVLDCQLQVDPSPTNLDRFVDHFGNHQVMFTVQRGHHQLVIRATSTIDVFPPIPDPTDMAWEAVATGMTEPRDQALLAASEYSFASPLIPTSDRLATYARDHFPPGRGLLAATTALTSGIFADFRYDPAATTLTTPVLEVLATRAGVCQDFAHLAIGALRSLGLAARYVSGYIETHPAPGEPKLRGADASHAWFQVFLPGQGWFDFDPTNDCRAGEQHVTCAYGRDFGDVTPTRGLILGGGEAEISVEVDVDRLV